jgi:pyridoxal phosphate enzyme (YggS family)
MTISDRVQAVRERLAAACARSGRPLADVTLVAATKTRSAEELAAAVRAGISDLGENYVQELLAKRAALCADTLDSLGPFSVSWHMIGHLQRNKVKYLVPGGRGGALALIHSVDNLPLAQEIDRRAREAGRERYRQPVLLEVNIAGEDSKTGVAPAAAAALAEQVAALEQVELQGLMAMPPYSEDPRESRPHFRALARLAAGLVQSGLPAGTMRHLSMGMSGDFEVAVEEGATLVRLGTVLFGPRADPALPPGPLPKKRGD